MVIARVDITGVECKRTDNTPNPAVKVMTAAEPVNVTKKKLAGKDYLLVDFELRTKYEPKIGELKVSGTAYYTDKNLKDRYTKDKKGKIKINPEVVGEVAQVIFTAPAVISVNMARELKLPMPIQFPRVQMTQKKE